MKTVADRGTQDLTFLQRMLSIAETNHEFTMEDVKAETITTLIAVRFSPIYFTAQRFSFLHLGN